MNFRKILIGFGVTLLVLLGIGVYALSRLDPKDYVALVDAKIRDATGRELRIDGKVGYSLSLRPTIAAEGIRFQNAPWGSRPDMITAKRVEIQIALLPLLRGDVEIRGLTLIEPDVLLEVGRDGAKNWDFKPGSGKNSQHGAPSAHRIEIHRARIERGVIAYRETRLKRETRIGLDRVALTGSANAIALKAAVNLNSVPLEIDATVENAGQIGRDDATGKARIALSAAGVKLNGEGVVPIGGGLEGLDIRMDAGISDWATLARLTKVTPPALPGLKAEASARVKAGILSIEDLKAQLGKSSAHGSLRIGLGEKASGLEAHLDSPFVDLSELQAPSKPSKSPPDARVFSAAPFAIGGVRGVNGKVDLRIAKLALRDGKTLDGVQAHLAFDNGKVTADPVRILVGGRELHLRLSADASSGRTVALNLAVDGQGIPLGALAAMLNVPGAPEGSPTDLSIRLSGNGTSMRSFMAGASGDVRIVVGPGRLKNQAINFGADITELLNAINPARASDPYTELKCAVIRLPIRQGVARVDNSIAAETSKVNIIVGGVIDLRNETLDLGVRPKAVTGLGVGLGGLASLGRLRGSFANPKVAIDATGAATAATQLGLAAVTGGLSLLSGNLLADSVPDHPCQAALSGNVRSQRAESQEKPGVVDSVLGGIKRLFGR